MGAGPVHARARCLAEIARGRVPGHPRAIRVRQVDAAAHSRLCRYALVGHAAVRRTRRGALPDAARSDCACGSIGFVFQRFFLLPMLTAAENVDLPQAEAGVAKADRAASAPRNCSTTSASRTAPTTGRRSCRAARRSAWRSRARWRTARVCCWPTSPPANSIAPPASRSRRCSIACSADGTTVVVVTHDATLAERASRRLVMRDGRIESEVRPVIVTMAWKSLAAHPIRSAVLGVGFGLGVSVMATLLGVGEVVLEQARSPKLVGGGDLLVTSLAGPVSSARFVFSRRHGRSRRAAALAAAPRRSVFVAPDGAVTPIVAHGGIPSLERALGDPETHRSLRGQTRRGMRRGPTPDTAVVLRAMDRFQAGARRAGACEVVG